MLEFIEVSFDQVALLVDPFVEREAAGSVLLRRNVGPSLLFCRQGTNGVSVVGAVGKQDGIGLKRTEHGGSRLAVMRLSGCQDEIDRSALGVDKRMDFGGESAAGTSHAAIVMAPLFAVAACW